MPDRPFPLKPGQVVIVLEDFAEQAQTGMGLQSALVIDDYARPFLTAVLQGMEAEVGQAGGVGMAPNAEDAAFLVKAFELR